jgi:uncharacterized protein YecT (DUF1311 family)
MANPRCVWRNARRQSDGEAKLRQIMAALALIGCIAAPQPASADRDERWDGIIASCVANAETRAALDQCTGVVSTPCMQADDTTMGMALCISNEADQWDALLQPLLQRAIAREPERAMALKLSQGAWRGWTEAECSYQASAAYGGSAQQPMLAECFRDLTAARAILLEWNERHPP